MTEQGKQGKPGKGFPGTIGGEDKQGYTPQQISVVCE
jgi:hypothetical protein